jgi:hypothetical protein
MNASMIVTVTPLSSTVFWVNVDLKHAHLTLTAQKRTDVLLITFADSVTKMLNIATLEPRLEMAILANLTKPVNSMNVTQMPNA